MISSHLAGRQLAVAILIIVFLVSIALAASAGPLRAERPPTTSPSTLSTPRHLIGTVDSVAQDQKSFKLTLKSGHQLTVQVTSTTQLFQFNPTKNSLSIHDLKSGSRVAVATTQIPADSAKANLILLLPSTTANYRIVHGTISDLTTSSFTLTLPDSKPLKVTLTPSTVYSKKDRHSPALIQQSDLPQGAQVLVIGTLSDNSLNAKLVHIIKL